MTETTVRSARSLCILGLVGCGLFAATASEAATPLANQTSIHPACTLEPICHDGSCVQPLCDRPPRPRESAARRAERAVLRSGFPIDGYRELFLQPDPEPEPEVGSTGPVLNPHAERVVLMVHGFGARGGHDCDDYFRGMREGLGAELGSENVVTIRWYAGDENCSDTIPGVGDNTIQTSVEEIATELADYVQGEYSANGVPVDIVAHSLGGLIVRSMLQQRGSDLLVGRVITLGTPHAGVYFSLPAFLGCPVGNIGIYQCVQSSAGSDFITSLEHNPQSAISTHWTLIGTHHDAVVGPETALSMDRGADWKPTVSAYEYEAHHLDDDDCWGRPILFPDYSVDGRLVGHGDLKRNDPTGWCTYHGWRRATYHPLANPTTRVLDALETDPE